MQVTTIEEARQLVGRTFERDGKRRTFRRMSVAEWKPGVVFTSYGGRERWKNGATSFVRVSIDEWNRWLAGAKEVTE